MIQMTGMQVYLVDLPFRFRFGHAAAQRDHAQSLLITLHSNTGAVGHGQILPREYLTGETIDSAIEDLTCLWWPWIKKLRFEPRESPLQTLGELQQWADAAGKTASYSGVDIAVCDAWARSIRLPGNRLWNTLTGRSTNVLAGSLPAPYLTATIGLGTWSLWQARLFKFMGYRQFKVKITSNDDLPRIAALRKILGHSLDLHADANGALALDQTLSLAPTLRELGVSCLEQPTPGRDLPLLAQAQEQAGLPIMADESLCNLADTRRLLALNPAIQWNLRLAKVGGFTGLHQLLQLARSNHVGCQLGVLVGETALLAAAVRAVACAPDDDAADWLHVEDGFSRWLLRSDPFDRPAGDKDEVRRGQLQPLGEALGLGVTLNPRRLNRLTCQQWNFE